MSPVDNSQSEPVPTSKQHSKVIWQFNSPGLASSTDSVPSCNLQPQPTDKLELLLVTSKGTPIKQVLDVTRSQVEAEAKNFHEAVSFPPRQADDVSYLNPAQQFYQWLIKPLEEPLEKQEITNLVFVMDVHLRSVPLAALHDGQGFVVEKYSVGLMPSMSLTDTRYQDIRNAEVLAMGTANFAKTPDLNSLPTVPLQIDIIRNLWKGAAEPLLDESFTVDNLKSSGIIHLATHAEFNEGSPRNSYIQFWGDERLRLDEIRDLGLKDVELLVLSACQTALGNEEAELGFTGLAYQAGIKSVLGSLWDVNEVGTLGLMELFYRQLREEGTIKAEALRQAQLAMLRKEVIIKDGQLILLKQGKSVPLPPELTNITELPLWHPYYWSGFTIVGNPW
jgi:CHAT domain-containing protein